MSASCKGAAQPLGQPRIFHVRPAGFEPAITIVSRWGPSTRRRARGSGWLDPSQRPPVPRTGALPTELHPE